MANIPHLSHSSLEDIRSCSEKFRLRKIEAVPQRPGFALVGGNTAHKVTETIDLRDFGVPVDTDDLDFAAVFEKYTAEAEERSGFSRAEFYASGRKSKDNPDKENAVWWLKHGPAMVARWVNFKKVTNWAIWLTPAGYPAVEVGLLAEYGGIPVRGFLDVIMELPDGDLAVVDKKFGANMPKSNNQLGQYADQAAKLFGEGHRPRWGTYWDGRTGSLTPPVDLAPLAKDLDEDYRKARLIIEQDLFLASPGMLCGSCSVNAYCKSFSGQATLPLPGSRVNIRGE